MLCKTLTTRATKGKKKNLVYENAAGSFQRYAVAACRTPRGYGALEITGPEQILFPRLNDAGLAKVKSKLWGWLDPEPKERSRLHDGGKSITGMRAGS